MGRIKVSVGNAIPSHCSGPTTGSSRTSPKDRVKAEVEVVVPGPKEATPVKVPLDSPDGMLQHISHLAGLQMSKGRAYAYSSSRFLNSLHLVSGLK
jgi:hypothetical protein